MISERNNFVNRDELARGLANRIASKLSAAVTRNGCALLAVSGGTTPKLFFEHLSRADISWNKVTVTLVDERQVPEDSPRSNAKLVKETLLQDKAAVACFMPLYKTPNAAKLAKFDAVVLGMGSDGHTASFFPGGDTLAEAINPDTSKSLVEISAPTSGEPRLTFTLPKLLQSGFLALHIEGAEKQAVLEKARSGDNIDAMPVRAVLQANVPLALYWCP